MLGDNRCTYPIDSKNMLRKISAKSMRRYSIHFQSFLWKVKLFRFIRSHRIYIASLVPRFTGLGVYATPPSGGLLYTCTCDFLPNRGRIRSHRSRTNRSCSCRPLCIMHAIVVLFIVVVVAALRSYRWVLLRSFVSLLSYLLPSFSTFSPSTP